MKSEAKYINLRDGKFVLSYDNWNTFKFYDKGKISGELESDLNTISEVKIRLKLGDYYGNFIVNELKKIESQFDLNEDCGYGEAFEIFALAVLLNEDINDVFNYNIVKGSNDGKIDAVVFDDKQISLYQIKIDFAPDYSKIKTTMRNNYNKYLDNRCLSDSSLSDLNDFFTVNDSKITNDLKLKIITICSNEEADLKPIDIFNKYIDNNFLNKTNGMTLVLRADQELGYTKVGNPTQTYAYFINAKKFLNNLLDNKSINNKKENLNKLFYDNVRGQLKKNDDMDNTIKNDSKNFVLYNNGITFTGNIDFEPDTYVFTINEPIISNGQQTIWNLINNMESSTLSKINLLIIIKDSKKSSEIKSNISRFTNTQTNIKPIDLLSLNYHIRNVQKNISYKTYQNDRYYININSSGTRGFEKDLVKCFKKSNIIKLIDFCKLYYCTEDKKIGAWKNSVSSMIKSKINNIKAYDMEKALKVCKIISEYNEYISKVSSKVEKNILSTTSLAIMYITYTYDYDFKQAKSVIEKINEKYFDNASPKPSKLIDLYKSDEILRKIEEFV